MGAVRPGMAVPVIRARLWGERAGRIGARRRVSASRNPPLDSDGSVGVGPAAALRCARGGNAPEPVYVVVRGSAVGAVRGNFECVARRRPDDPELSDDATGKAPVTGRFDATLGPVGRSG